MDSDDQTTTRGTSPSTTTSSGATPLGATSSPRATSDDEHRSTQSRLRRPVVAGSVALALAVAVGGAARADNLHGAFLLGSGSSSYLSTNSATVAGSVNGALVDVVSTLGYQNATAAGTGMVLSSNGEILTNNHVVNGATSVKVTVLGTGRTYPASVVGTDPTQDVAVLQLTGASGLKTLPIGDSSTVKVGQKVVASGNAGGVGGTPSTVKGSVTALAQDITAGDEGSSDTEQLTGLIQTDAPIVAGDSGGALSISGKVIGMNTAASSNPSSGGDPWGAASWGSPGSSGSIGSSASSGSQSSGAAQAYAIPIQTALTIAHKIETGQASSIVHLGTHGFLGVELTDASAAGDQNGFYGNAFGDGNDDFGGGYGSGDSGSGTASVSGALVAGVVSSGAAADAGLSAGDVITAVNGRAVDGITALNTIMATTHSGQKVSLTWTDTSGQSQTSSVTLSAAAAD